VTERVALAEAIERHVRPGDSVHVAMGHHRWTALARELARHYWGSGPGLELVMASLGSLGTLFFQGGLLRRVVTAYSGDSFPAYGPNPVFTRAYDSGEVEVEHWSFLTLRRRLEAAALGLPVAVTKPLGRSGIAENSAYDEVWTPRGPVGMLAPLAPDVSLMHAVLADEEGNLACAPPGLDGVVGAWAARRGCVATVERVVPSLAPYAGFARVPAHRVLAVVEAPFGAHPGGMYGAAVGEPSYAEDVDFWIEARVAARGDLDAWARRWCRDVASHEDYLRRLGEPRLEGLRATLIPDDAVGVEPAVDTEAPATEWETAASFAARVVCERVLGLGADTVLAGAGVANLAAWVGVARARAAGSPVQLTAELGLWGYEPTPGSPFIFDLRSFPSATLLGDAETVLGLVIGGPGTRALGCLGAAQVDARGDLNSTRLAGGRSLVGSGGGADVAVGADENIVVTLLRPQRTPEEVGYVTGPGDRVSTIVTDKGILRREGDGSFALTEVPAAGGSLGTGSVGTGSVGTGSLDDAAREAVAACGWPLAVARTLTGLSAPTTAELLALRRYDPRGWFLRD
jgi:acyl CoA:acetate/3-ketoacid CoA transferase alpha subunit